jgi:hypothetical protein
MVPESSDVRLDYARAPRRRAMPRKRILLIAAFVSLPILLALASFVYVSYKREAVAAGMTRKQVDAELWAFRSYPLTSYGGLDPGQVCIVYELFGQWVQVVYESDGTLGYVIPAD